MEKNPKLISIIIPVYNVGRYIRDCVNSCLSQDYENCEIVLVDDGSTDDSGTICDEIAEKYSNVTCYHKKNGGLSDARNYGIEHANGEYIMFVDSDDVISESLVSNLFDGLNTEAIQCDMSVCGLEHFRDGETPRFKRNDGKKIISMEDALIDFLYQKNISTSACAKLYKTGLFDDNRFVKGQRFEDNDFLFRTIQRCNNIGLINSNLYGYRHRDASITTSNFSYKDFDIIDIGKKVIEETSSFSDKIQQAARVYQCSNAMRVYLTAPQEFFEDERYRYCKAYLDLNAIRVICDVRARKKIKIGLLLYKLGISSRIMFHIRENMNRWH